MDTRRAGFFALMLTALLVAGCDKKTDSSKETPLTPSGHPVVAAPAAPVLARIHWLGKKGIAENTNSASLMRIWNEPESATLGAQTLEKLSLAPWRLTQRPPDTNAAARLRLLLEDVVEAESYLEVRGSTNQPGELAFAIRLSPERAGEWETNVASVLETLTGIRPVLNSRGGSLKKHDSPDLIQWTRAGEWTVLGAAQGTNVLFDDFIGRIQRAHAPYSLPAPPVWLDANIDLNRVARALSLDWKLPAEFPRIALAVMGGGEQVRTRCELNFSPPSSLTLEPWVIPTNLIRGPLASFTAARGVRPWLASLKAWNDLGLGEAPNQLIAWASQAVPMQTFLAVPVPDSTNRMAEIIKSLPERINPWLTTNGSGYLLKSEEFQGLVWSGIPPFLAPYIRSEGDFISAGFFPPSGAISQLPADMLQVLNQTNVAYYDWEITGPRIESWFHLGQFFRVVMHKSQLPESPSMAWLQVNASRLGNCVTVGRQTGPDQLTFIRNSTVGFSAFELHLLGDWLESPQFPHGFHTLLDSPGPRSRPPVKLPGQP